ncbi:methyltransferase domain-containing protein [Chlorogloeopsis sp. ULAP01]|uniref:class I SAM-dependent methyltransferase n=1 Tax=Chlorogloeopsis sp. ULAP01 TaxID=3056483 RepID=UPI0025AACDF6|nr:methyltransferase domain-containing protein [Chlorogloeopsis sp. ULAP01]MDM9383275.1 methyltransferase domain-containing protein [Chlorogloeopsis sp. ULAP01]
MLQTLQSWQEIQNSREQLQERGLDFTDPLKTRFWRFLFDLRFRYQLLPPQPDVTKSWDVAKAVEVITSTVPNKLAPILDMGCFNSEILYVLHALGYKSLHGCDLNPICHWMFFWHQIRYCIADLTQTSYPNHYFAAITCLSVIEHGVPLDNLVKEVRRILQPGGLFILTTDYDATGQEHKIPEDFQIFGLNWTIFNQATLQELIQKFIDVGFHLLEPDRVLNTHTECPITWHGENYSFVMVALKAPETKV